MFKKYFLHTILSLFLFCSLLPTISFPKITNQEPIKVMSFNIRYDNSKDGVNQWANRKELAMRTIQKFKIDIVGMQEVLKNQLDDCLKLLPEYAFCGVARNDGKNSGEFSPIFFLKNRFELLQDSTVWLSETPAVIGSRGWDAALPRIVTWAKLRDKKTSKVFYFYNTHFDHRGKTARKESAVLITKLIHNIAGTYPVILTGDFNCTEADAPYKVLTKDNSELADLKDAYYLCPKNETDINYSFNGWGRAKGARRIDYIFVNLRLKVKKHSIFDIKDGEVFISDHFPVFAEILIKD